MLLLDSLEGKVTDDGRDGRSGQGMYRLALMQYDESDIHFARENAWKEILKKVLRVSDEDFSTSLFVKDVDNIT